MPVYSKETNIRDAVISYIIKNPKCINAKEVADTIKISEKSVELILLDLFRNNYLFASNSPNNFILNKDKTDFNPHFSIRERVLKYYEHNDRNVSVSELVLVLSRSLNSIRKICNEFSNNEILSKNTFKNVIFYSRGPKWENRHEIHDYLKQVDKEKNDSKNTQESNKAEKCSQIESVMTKKEILWHMDKIREYCFSKWCNIVSRDEKTFIKYIESLKEKLFQYNFLKANDIEDLFKNFAMELKECSGLDIQI